MSDQTMHVVLNVRPLIEREKKKNDEVIIKRVQEKKVEINDPNTKNSLRYDFDNIFTADDDRGRLYEESVKPLMTKLFEGYNVSILAYGQTASGKTFTMGAKTNNMDGVIPRVVKDIFDRASLMEGNGHRLQVQCSFVEIIDNTFKVQFSLY